MKFGSVCSGIEAVSLAWNPLGMSSAWFSEIDPYCCELLRQKYPHTPNAGDLARLANEAGRLEAIDILVGGTPCQSFSVAGLGAGLDDERGNLALEFCRLAGEMRPGWVVWENATGVLSSNGGRDFGAIVGALDKLGYGLAWRVLDAQFFGVPQRRRRVFLIGHLGDWRRAAAVLFDRQSLRGNSTTRPFAKKGTAGTVTAGAGKRRGSGQQPETLIPEPVPVNAEGSDGATLTNSNLSKRANNQQPLVIAPDVASTLTARTKGENSNQPGRGQEDDYNVAAVPTSSGEPSPGAAVFQARYARNGRGAPSDVAPALTAEAGSTGKGDAAPLIFDPTQITSPENRSSNFDQAPTLAESAKPPVVSWMAIRRLMPVEAERLQGMPDNYTAITYRGKPASDTQRYRAIGNSMAVPVLRWIGERILMAEEIKKA